MLGALALPVRLSVAALLVLGGMPPAAAGECGGREGRCETALGVYRLAMPEGAGAPVPALLYLHGYGGSAAGVMRNRAMLDTLGGRGYALIAPEGVPNREGGRQSWGVRDGGSHPRDDVAFLREVLDDAGLRGVARDRVLVAGFSRGGSMVWDLACLAPGTGRAYAPVSGAFWLPMPAGCAGPVDLFHTHGWTDRVVPLEGRSVAGGRLTQGDVFAALAILRDTNGCDARQPDAAAVEGAVWERRWTSCRGGSLRLMLHPGGHALPADWLDRALDWFEGLSASGGAG